VHSECDHPIFQSTKFEFGLRTHSQAGEDIGERMFNAFVHLTRQSPAILIGTDCPILSSDHIARCAAALIDGAEAAFAPVEDGGYALIGLRKAAWQIFEGIPWGTGDVMRMTRESSSGTWTPTWIIAEQNHWDYWKISPGETFSRRHTLLIRI
jgi:glycosyltransferase A (GT-A) superfamily protein (DUF2064 family)